MNILAIIILGMIWAYREIVHTKQLDRKDDLIGMLTDKLMARNFEEYKELTTEPKVYEPVEMSEEEEWAREQKERLEQ